MSNEPVFIGGIPVRAFALEAAARAICADAVEGTPRVYALINAHSSKLRREHPRYAELIADVERVVCLPDGASVTQAGKLLGYPDVGRSPGPDLIEACSELCAAQGIPVFLLGGADGVADRLGECLSERHGGLALAGTATPPFGDWPDEVSQRLVHTVRDSGARLVWMGVSAPKQEIWAWEHAAELGVPLVCVGAAFDFNTGAKPRAPRWMRRLGIEWVHRLLTEPRRMWKRYLVGNALFVADVLRFGRRAADFRR